MHSSFLGRSALVVVTLAIVVPANLSAAPPLANVFKRTGSSALESLELTQKHGPWMIFAGSFAGPGAEDDARKLVQELRSRYRLPAYVHKQHYDFTKPVRGKGYNPEGGPKIMKYRQEGSFDEIAVLVGNYGTVNDPGIQKTLLKIKYIKPQSLSLDGDKPTTLRFAGLRALNKSLNKDAAKKAKGPLGQAFVSRNPLLPEEFFVPKGIDPMVEKMNAGVKHSILDCPGKYSVRVATFRGNVVLDQKKIKEIKKSGRMESRLAEAAAKAHKLTTLLRARGIEAYEFHDRYESIVAVGSFNSVGLPRKDGRIEINPTILKLIQSYSPQRQSVGNGISGLTPRSLGGVPFDVQPTAVEVPKRSIAASVRGNVRRGGSVR